MVVKSKMVSEHVGDLRNIFEILRKHKLRLNASKCSFGVGSGKFLGFMVTHRGIEVNPDQVKAINSLQPPRNPKEVQKLTGMTAALNRFISRSADRYRPFFLLMNKWKGFEWTEECALAFQQLKEYLSHPPIMSSLEMDEVLFAYITVPPPPPMLWFWCWYKLTVVYNGQSIMWASHYMRLRFDIYHWKRPSWR